MAYAVSINRKIRNTRTYVVLNRVNQKTNKLSIIIQGIVMRLLAGKNGGNNGKADNMKR